MSAGGLRGNQFVGPAETKSVVVGVGQSTSGFYPAFKFPADGYLTGATLFSNADQDVQVGLLNGGADGAGSAVSAPQSAGSMAAGSAYALSVTPGGPEAYAGGELVLVDLTTSGAADCELQIDYVIDPVPVP
jgi:hypothetical protein